MMKHKSVRYLLGTALLGTVAILSGCSILPTAEPQTRYKLPATTLTTATTQKNTSLYVATPQANRLVNSNRILVQPAGNQIQIYQGSQWVDNAPALVRDRLIQALNDTHLYQAISSDSALNTQWALMGTLQQFQVQYQNDHPVIMVQYDAQLIERKTSTIVQSQRFFISQPASDASVPSVVNAFGLASDQLSLEVVDWLAKH